MGHLGPKRGQNEVLGHFLGQNALVFADSVYYDWELWYLVPSGGQSAEKDLLALKWAQLGPKRGQNEVLGHFLAQNALVFADSVYYDWELWYLVASGGQSAEKFFVGPKMGSIGAKRGPKWGFRPFSCSKLIRSCRFCILWLRITISSIWWWSRCWNEFRWP